MHKRERLERKGFRTIFSDFSMHESFCCSRTNGTVSCRKSRCFFLDYFLWGGNDQVAEPEPGTAVVYADSDAQGYANATTGTDDVSSSVYCDDADSAVSAVLYNGVVSGATKSTVSYYFQLQVVVSRQLLKCPLIALSTSANAV